MKDQLKKTFSDASRHAQTKNEEIIKAKGTFLTEDFSQMTIQHEYSTDKVIIEQDYHPFRTDSQKSYENEYDTTTKGITDTITKNMHTDKTNSLLECERCKNNIKYAVPNRKRKNPCERNGVQLRCQICESLHNMPKNCPKKNDTYTLDTLLEIDNAEIAKDDGVDAIIHRLNRLFKKDSTITKYKVVEAFETFTRPSDMSI